MRGLLKASLLLAPALASVLVVPDVHIEDVEIGRVIAGNYFSFRSNAQLTITSVKTTPLLLSLLKFQHHLTNGRERF